MESTDGGDGERAPTVVPVTDDEELDALRRKRLQEMESQQVYQEEALRQQASAEAEVESQRQAALRRILSPEARDRIGRLRTAHPDLAASVEDQLMSLARSGRLGRQVSDGDLRKILRQLAPQKREINITIKK